MVKKEEKVQSLPSLVDYAGSSESAEVERWTSSNFESYWKQLVLKKWKAGGILFSIKDRTLISKMIKEFGQDNLKIIIEWFVKTNDLEKAKNVGILYKSRDKLWEQIKPKDYSDWLE